jgi:exosortase A-associated hydrolase 1
VNGIVSEIPIVFDCDGDRLLGIHHRPERCSDIGVLIIVGGPQYRVGSHRQFLLLARRLADAGISSFRFDCRGMGDSEGDPAGFDAISGELKSAIDTFCEAQPGLKRIVLWGLCDAAAAAMLYAHCDSRVSSMVLLNPWVTTQAGQAKTLLKHYYVGRLLSKEFWKRLFSGDVGLRRSVNSLLGNLGRVLRTKDANEAGTEEWPTSFVNRMQQGFGEFNGSSLFIISGDDLTAAEFEDLVAASRPWRKLMRRTSCQTVRLEAADHTFSTDEWRRFVEKTTIDWVLQQ